MDYKGAMRLVSVCCASGTVFATVRATAAEGAPATPATTAPGVIPWSFVPPPTTSPPGCT
jgi:hypothetical protein